MRAHWARPQQAEPSRLDTFYDSLSNLYIYFNRLIESLADMLEGDGGILWALLFLVLYLSLLTPRIP